MTPQALRDALASMASSVAVLTTGEPGQVRGVTLTSFVGLSLAPALAAFACRFGSRMLGGAAPGDLVGVTVLAEGQELIARRCAAPDRGPLPDSQITRGEQGVPYVSYGAAHFILRVMSHQLAGDHILVVAEILDGSSSNGAAAPLLYHHRQYRRLAIGWPRGDVA